MTYAVVSQLPYDMRTLADLRMINGHMWLLGLALRTVSPAPRHIDAPYGNQKISAAGTRNRYR